MWQALKDQCRNQAPCDVVAIPHNGNIGLGSYTLTGMVRSNELRAQFEKLVEIHQHKVQANVVGSLAATVVQPSAHHSDPHDLRLNKRDN